MSAASVSGLKHRYANERACCIQGNSHCRISQQNIRLIRNDSLLLLHLAYLECQPGDNLQHCSSMTYMSKSNLSGAVTRSSKSMLGTGCTIDRELEKFNVFRERGRHASSEPISQSIACTAETAYTPSPLPPIHPNRNTFPIPPIRSPKPSPIPPRPQERNLTTRMRLMKLNAPLDSHA